ncbi:MAG: hypothetical protein DIU78_012835 [Pseudomonadota bacterium]
MPKPDPRKSRLELIADDVHAALADSSVKQLFGREALKEHAQRRRIVWLHAPSTIVPAEQASGDLLGESEQDGTRFTALWQRIEQAELNIYAEHDGAVDRLFEAVLKAIGRVAPTARFGGYAWPSDLPNEAGINQRQPWIALRVGFPLTVVEDAPEMVIVTGEDHDCGIIQSITDPFPPEGGFPDEE